ncbi:Armadillo [Corchorus capsularis]|uniref:Armadillo n=1 Tax=Corchorus capsularis TaxID=210143 RepID=A0A1R3HXT5_COCAP|nr:Armadillo [Corchorus capsularis]
MLHSEGRRMQKLFWDLSLLEEKISSAVEDVKSFVEECSQVRKRSKQLSEMLDTLLCFINSTQVPLYFRPIDCIVSTVKDNLELALDIVSKCKRRRSLLGRLFTGCNATQFHKLFNLLDASIRDMEWLVTVYDPKNGAMGPVSNKKSARMVVWSCIATAQMARKLDDRIHTAKLLASLAVAEENDEYKELIFEEGGVPLLQQLLKKTSSVEVEAQITVANALCLLATDEKRKDFILKEMVSSIVNRLSRKSPLMDQIQAVDLVSSIIEHKELKEYHLIRENVIWRLVTLLSPEESTETNLQTLELRIRCSKALLKLALGSVKNCRTLTETKGMLCLAKLVETEQDELQSNCLMIIKEITTLAESNEEFRHSTFKTTSAAAKAVVHQLLRVTEEFDTKLKIPAIKSIGSLARSFSAKHSQVITPLVSQLDNANQEVALEAAKSLQKFVCPDNGLKMAHSKSIIESNGIPLLMNLIHGDKEKELQQHGLALMCYLAKHVENREALIKAGALTALETTGCKVAAEDRMLNKLVTEAIEQLRSNRTDDNKPQEPESSSECSIKQIFMENSKAAFGSLRCGSNVLFEKLTSLPQKLQVKPSSMENRCEMGLSVVSYLRNKRISHSPRRLRDVMDHLGARLAKAVAQNLWLKNIDKQSTKKLIRKKFGFIIHKFCQNVKCKYW